MMIKICIIGLGSIGKRHLRNIVDVCNSREINFVIHAFRSNTSKLEDDIVANIEKETVSFEELDEFYDAVFITNPTVHHFSTLECFANKTHNFFIEKPLFHTSDVSISTIPFLEDSAFYVAAPLRHSKTFVHLKKLLSEEKVFSVRSICSSYLPEWRPGKDYRDLYCSKKEMGGGVELDLIHEWDYISVLFGFPERVNGIMAKKSNLEVETNDIAVYIAEYTDKIVELHIDYFGREVKRELSLLTENGTITADFINQNIYFSDNRKTINLVEDVNEMYLREIQHFFNIIDRKVESSNDLSHGQKVLSLALTGQKGGCNVSE